MREYNVTYFTASCDDVEINTRFAKELELDYTILSDPEKKVAQAYGVVHGDRQVPERWTFIIGEDGKILHIDRQVKPGDHGADVVKQLESLGVEKKKKE